MDRHRGGEGNGGIEVPDDDHTDTLHIYRISGSADDLCAFLKTNVAQYTDHRALWAEGPRDTGHGV
ncbi:hypothetical protein MACH23_04270 [Sulfitobacter pontiacus]|nr:hypothetical protein MACH23_04270 [Sulfitobacter pontiacus]